MSKNKQKAIKLTLLICVAYVVLPYPIGMIMDNGDDIVKTWLIGQAIIYGLCVTLWIVMRVFQEILNDLDGNQ